MLNSSCKFARRQHGFSLVELMVAMLLGIVVVGAVLQLFVGSRTTQISTTAMADMQENARFSLELIKKELRGLDAFGFCAGEPLPRNHLDHTDPTSCGSAEPVFNAVYSFGSDASTDVIDRWDRPVVGWEYTGTGPGDSFDAEADLNPENTSKSDWAMWVTSLDRMKADQSLELPDARDGKVVAGSDVVVVRRMIPVLDSSERPVVLSHRHEPVDVNLSLHDAPDSSFKLENHLMLITNCSKIDVFFNTVSTNVLSSDGGTCGEWATAYDETAQFYAVKVYAYFVGYNDDTKEPGLYRADFSHGLNDVKIEELVEGLENMQVLYGYSHPVDGSGERVDEWLTAEQVPSWKYVIATRMSFLMRSVDGMGDHVDYDDMGFSLAGMTYRPANEKRTRLRQPFHLTVGLRNRQVVIERD